MVMSGCCSLLVRIFSIVVARVIFGFLPLFLGLGVMFPMVRYCCPACLPSLFVDH